jgi:hypothetical protein
MGLLIVILIFVAVWTWRSQVPLFSTNKQARAEFLARWWRFAKVELVAWAFLSALAYALTEPAKWPGFVYGLIFLGLGLLCSRIVIWLSALPFYRWVHRVRGRLPRHRPSAFPASMDF